MILLNQPNQTLLKPKPIFLLALALCCLAQARLRAAGFSSGSDGSLGALNVPDDQTVDLPPNGRLNYTTVSVAAGKTLTFRRNALNTPVYLLASGDVTIAGSIDVSGARAPTSTPIGGAGGPGGFDGGKPGFTAEVGPGNGYGPGGARRIERHYGQRGGSSKLRLGSPLGQRQAESRHGALRQPTPDSPHRRLRRRGKHGEPRYRRGRGRDPDCVQHLDFRDR
jgi:hypothetical protein